VTLLATITEEREGEIPVLVIEGEIDASNSLEIAGRLRGAITNQGTVLIVDLSPTTYIDSAGINVIFKLARELRERQQQLHLVVTPGSPIARMVAIVGLDVAVPTHPTREAAHAAVA
jgi:anti-anti-sigma factor